MYYLTKLDLEIKNAFAVLLAMGFRTGSASVATLLVALASTASAIQINPNYGETYEIQSETGAAL